MEGVLDAFESDNLFDAPKQSFLTVGGITKNCIRCLTKVKKGQQKIVIGDTRGIIYITDYVDDAPRILIKTDAYSNEIKCIQLTKLDEKTEAIYFAEGNSIYSIDENNKNKFKVEFNIASNIEYFCVVDNNQIYTVTNKFLNKFQFGEVTNEVYTFDNGCPISIIQTTNIPGNNDKLLLIGSDDNKIKITDEEEIIKILPTNGRITCFCPIAYEYFYYGTTTGTVGCLYIKDKENINILFETKDKQENEIVGMKLFDINFDGKEELLLIRTNGLVEIYNCDIKDRTISVICRYETHEHLTGLDVGRYKDKEHTDIILSSLSGLVFALMPELTVFQKLKNIDSKTLKKNILVEEKEVEDLKLRLMKRKEEFEKMKTKQVNNIVKNNFKLEYKFTLLEKESVFLLTIDSEFPMELVVLHCTLAKLDILKVKTKEVSMNVFEDGVLDNETKSHCKFLATFSLKEANHRLELIVRTYEGIKDDINISIIPYNKPKTAQIIHIPVYSLSFHKLYEPKFDTDVGEVVSCEDDKITNVLTIEGMRNTEINQILHLIIPNIPDVMKEEEAKYLLRSTFLNTLLEINIDSNKCEIKCPFVSTLITLKKQINKEADKRRKTVQTRIKFKELSINKILEVLNPKIMEIFNLEKEYRIIQAFKELGNTISLNDLPSDYIQILNKTEEINKKYGDRSLNLNYYKSLIIQLFLDVKEIRNAPNNKLDEINMLMEDYSYEKLVNIFNFLNN